MAEIEGARTPRKLRKSKRYFENPNNARPIPPMLAKITIRLNDHSVFIVEKVKTFETLKK
ncbi:hypothetical protein [Maribacter sp. 2210JD10-5]|uniref:hypothetical protein n=1 Tax=Maribacter sp. 2210JD10-5 TaxID=3386272 RepID=UPI0039BCA64C